MADAPLDPAVSEQLAAIRLSIDNMDAAIVHLLAERFKFTQQVGRLKAAHGLPPSDPEGAQLDPAFAEKWFNFVVAEVIHHHERIATASIPTSRDDAE